MINYSYIEDLFKHILTSSKSIQGRFHTGWRYGLQEINYDQLGEVLGKINNPKKYPLVMMAPPHSFMHLTGHDADREQFRVTLFFCNQSMVTDINVKTNTSTHSIPDDWQDMKRSALGFMRALLNIQRNTRPPLFSIKDNQIFFVPFSNIGLDRVSGIRLDFNLKLHQGCEVEDYEELPSSFEPLETDSHAEHTF